MSRRHRVQAMLWEGLQPLIDDIPKDCAEQLRHDAEEVVRSNLEAAVECCRLLQLFQSDGVDLFFLKGLALAALAYPDPYLKMGWDIDLLVPPDRIAEASRLMRKAGYVPAIPHLADTRQLIKWHKARKESVWQSSDGRFHVDLHSRLADNPAMLRNVGLQSPRQTVTLSPGIDLPTLGPEEQFAYLSVHGASSAWFRLKWVVDLAALLASTDSAGIEHLYRRSQQLGAGRAAAQALLLVDRLCGSNLGSGLRDRLNRDIWTRWLVSVGMRQLGILPEPTDRRLGTSMIHLSQLALMPGPGFLISEARRQMHDVAGRAFG